METLPAVAVSVTVCDVARDTTSAMNLALLALEGTVTVDGTVIAALLLDRLTVSPLLAAAALSDTVQA